MKRYRSKQQRKGSITSDEFFSGLSNLAALASSLISDFTGMSSGSSTTSSTDDVERKGGSASVDFTQEAFKVMSRTNIKNPHLDPIYKSPTGSIIYCGDYHVASDIQALRKHNIKYVVNCTRPSPSGELPNYHEGRGDISYFNFPIANWQKSVQHKGKKTMIDSSAPDVYQFFQRLFQFLDRAMASGSNVLVHCLAGCHRAGSTCVGILMHYEDQSLDDAIIAAKISRPIIDPIGCLPELLQLFQTERMKRSKVVSEKNSSSSTRQHSDSLPMVRPFRRPSFIQKLTIDTDSASAERMYRADSGDSNERYKDARKSLDSILAAESAIKSPASSLNAVKHSEYKSMMVSKKLPAGGVHAAQSKRLTY